MCVVLLRAATNRGCLLQAWSDKGDASGQGRQASVRLDVT